MHKYIDTDKVSVFQENISDLFVEMQIHSSKITPPVKYKVLNESNSANSRPISSADTIQTVRPKILLSIFAGNSEYVF